VQLSETRLSQELTPNVITGSAALQPFVTPPDGNGQSNPSPPLPVGPSAEQGGKFSGASPHCSPAIRPITFLRDDAGAGAHAQCDHLQSALATPRDDVVAGAGAQRDHREAPLQLFETVQSQKLTPNLITYFWPRATLRDDAVTGAHAQGDHLQFGP
jgi:hypothetical protein